MNESNGIVGQSFRTGTVALFGIGSLGGCAPLATALITLAIFLGGVIVGTVVGKSIEVALDTWVFPEEEIEAIVEYPDDPLKGTYHGTMRVDDEESGGTAFVQDPTVVRDSIDTNIWTLDPDVKAKVVKKLRQDGDNPSS